MAQYERRYGELKETAHTVDRLIRSIVDDAAFDVHLVAARAKHPDSLRSKVRRKEYSRPSSEITDTIGVRIITYYRDDVDRVVESLKAEFDVDLRRSVDRRQLLDLRAFGYRSVHLIVRLRSPRARMSEYASVSGLWIEIQVRSLLEHAWAEIEHEVVYKSGVQYAKEVLRQFAALAGALEILDGEFLELRRARNQLIDKYRSIYKGTGEDQNKIDVARLLGFLEARFPNSLSWRGGFSSGRPFPAGIEASYVEALDSVGLKTAASLRSTMGSPRFRTAVRAFASTNCIQPSSVSHLGLVVIAVALKNEAVLRTYFPEMVRDPPLQAVLGGTSARDRPN